MTTQNTIATINDFIESVGFDKAAESNTEPGSIGGSTTHPTGSEEDGTSPATEGARSSENTADVKDSVGAGSVDGTPEVSANAPSTAASDQLQIGMNVQATGDDPSCETESVKADKDDPGSSHPARTDNDSLDGNKYAEEKLAELSLEELSKVASELGDDTLSYIFVQSEKAIKQAEADGGEAAAPTTDEQKQAAAAYQQLVPTYGWDIAGLITGQFDKQAADAMAEETLTAIVKEAAEDADRFATYMQAYQQEKQSMDPAMMDPAAGGMPPEMGGGEMPPAEDPAAMMAALGGEGAPPEGAPMGGAPEGGGELDLATILQTLGISEEELLEAIAQEGGMEGGMEGGDPMGGMPPEEDNGAAPAPEEAPSEAPMEVQASDATGATKQAAILSYIEECVARNRARKVR